MKKIPLKKYVIFSVVILTCMPLQAQSLIDNLAKKFDQYRQNALQEKLYVHTSQDFFLTGELLWFKIYDVDGTLHRPLSISRLAYLELVDKNNSPVLQTKVGLKEGAGDGSLFLPVALNSGQYTLRAYTNWMKNFGAAFYFQKTITIINPFVKLDAEKNPASPNWDVQFFPEGGNLVSGLKSTVAFRAIDTGGMGIDFKGSLVNDSNDTLVRFNPLKFGMGQFSFTPVDGNKYRAVIDDGHGHKKLFNLPEVMSSGYVIHVTEGDEQITVQVNSNLTTDQNVYLFVHARQMIASAKMNTVQALSSASFTLAKKDLQEGISHITLFNGALESVCERLYFKAVTKNLSIDSRLETEYTTRAKVKIELSAKGSTQTAHGPHLSVSVYREDSLQASPSLDIRSYFWVSSDLAGTVESPQFYNNSSDPLVKESTDNVMLTHGWRRFKWTEVLSTSKPDIKFVPEYRGHLISGTLLVTRDSAIQYDSEVGGRGVRGNLVAEKDSIAAGVGTYLSTPGKNIELYPSVSDSHGEVRYEVVDFYGSTKVIAHAQSLRGEPYKFILRNPFSSDFSQVRIPEFHLSPLKARQILSRTVGMQVQNTFRDEDKDHFSKETRDSVAFFGTPDEVYLLDDFTRFPVMEEVMREYIKGVWVRKNKDGFRFMIFDRLNEILMRENPLMLLDGVPFQDPDKIMDYDALKVKKIETFRKKFYLGPVPFQGVLSFTTYNKEAEGFILEADNFELNYEGLQSRREFYSPQYDTRRLRESRLPDRRYQLYWNPNLEMNSDGTKQIEFYTSDLTGTYRLVVEGMNDQGDAGSTSSTFTVKK